MVKTHRGLEIRANELSTLTPLSGDEETEAGRMTSHFPKSDGSQ